MKKTTTQFFCDRCGAEIENSQYSSERRLRRLVVERPPVCIQFFRVWTPQRQEPMITTYELCNECRASLDQWLEGAEMKNGGKALRQSAEKGGWRD